ncbi:MAG: hypothetical protein MJY52_03835 [Bacteroidaceae bacterium]|nr:hypothetical protein [Bacteroidaceae bacterium]
MKYIKRSFLPLCASVILMSCVGDLQYNSPFACRFHFDNSIHLNSLMAAAVTPNSNIYLKINTKFAHQITYTVLQTYGGESQEIPMTTEIESYGKNELGGNNQLILGYNTLDEKIVAYDGMCRFCYEQSNRYTNLTLISSFEAKCPRCNKVYNLMMSGISDDDNPTQLWQYHVSAPNPYGIISISR